MGVVDRFFDALASGEPRVSPGGIAEDSGQKHRVVESGVEGDAIGRGPIDVNRAHGLRPGIARMLHGGVKVPAGNLHIEVLLRLFYAGERCSHLRQHGFARLEIEEDDVLRCSNPGRCPVRYAKGMVELNHEITAESGSLTCSSVKAMD